MAVGGTQHPDGRRFWWDWTGGDDHDDCGIVRRPVSKGFQWHIEEEDIVKTVNSLDEFFYYVPFDWFSLAYY